MIERYLNGSTVQAIYLYTRRVYRPATSCETAVVRRCCGYLTVLTYARIEPGRGLLPVVDEVSLALRSACLFPAFGQRSQVDHPRRVGSDVSHRAASYEVPETR